MSNAAIRCEVPRIPPLLNTTLRQHWGKRRRTARAWAWEIKAATIGHIPAEPFARAHVLIERFSRALPDDDGLVGGCKPLLDVLQPASKRHPYGLGIIAGDDPVHLTAEYRPRLVKARHDEKTVITIMPLESS